MDVPVDNERAADHEAMHGDPEKAKVYAILHLADEIGRLIHVVEELLPKPVTVEYGGPVQTRDDGPPY